ncbi:MAG: FAD-binding oxidoreductase [Bacteroidetes bacterium]|nr:MAG: FAD-binding oxidoreductase [Bacteroidota bacterium]
MQDSTFIQALRAAVKGEVLNDAYSLGLYATDASFYQIKPIVVVLPKDEEDVRQAVKLAVEAGVSILPRGGGTSLAGQTVGHSMVLDFSKYMNQLLELNLEQGWARVQPGLVRDELNALLAPHGLHFAPDPATSSRANIGGMIGNNSSGTKSILYGKTVDHVLELQLLLADGTELLLSELQPDAYAAKIRQHDREGQIYKGVYELINTHKDEIKARFPKVMRRVGGYNLDELVDTPNWNLAKLLVGSEGTLGITLSAKIKLTPLPKHTAVCVVHFSQVLQAIRAVQPMLKYRPSAIEILDETVIRLSRENLLTARHCHFIEQDPAAILIVEFYGDTPEEVATRPRQMVEELKRLGLGYAYPIFTDQPRQEDVWVVRKKGLGLMLGIKGRAKPLAFIEDAGIPVEHLPNYIDEVLQLCKSLEVDVAMYAHASVGVIHVRPILDLRRPDHIRKLKQIADGTFELVVKYGGSWSGEHGDGLVRSPYNERFFGPVLYQAFKDLKRLFDPQWLMNPGKIVEAPPMDQNLRYGADYQAHPPKTHYHYRSELGFEEAVDMCTGVGECRKLLSGTMCPSFMATRQEEHSTRGRANALRLAISGQLDAEGLSSPRLREVLDLCLSCKACKAECPSNVDMAKLKSEVAQLYYDRHGPGLRDRLVGQAAQSARRFAGRMAGLVNRIQATGWFRKSLENMAGIDARRVLPSYAAQPFVRWFAGRTAPQQSGRPRVALFADTYLNYHEPQIGRAAVALLEACGYEVLLAAVGCCQRPKISHGFLRAAKQAGLKTLQALDAQFLSQGIPVLLCEPSCASALLDDLPDLIDDEALIGRIRQHVSMIDVFLAQEKAAGRLRVRLQAPPALLHGHCHQKALFGTQAMKQLPENDSITEIPAGCCGMAGSFGYEKEHYELSRRIGERRLFPAIRQAGPETEILACGFSCRHQIAHFTGKTAKHWVECIRVED